MRPRREYLDSPTPIGFAHRGGAHESAENSLAAFSRAVDLGFEYLETDVHVTADGVVVVFHDDTLDRVTTGHGRVSQHSWESLSRVRLLGGLQLVRLEELLAEFPHVRVNIDLKSDRAVEAVWRIVRRTNSYDRVCVASFSGTRIKAFRELSHGRVCTAASPAEVARVRFGASRLHGARRNELAADCLQIPIHAGRVRLLTPALLDHAHQLGLAVHVWTIDDSTTMRELLDMGVDGIMTDAPSVLASELRRRGVWPRIPIAS